jgi:trehalose 6-phosphate synthase/phosphatase
MAARPDEELLRILERLCADPLNTVIITSGRDHETLYAWLGHLNLDMIAEHGAWYKEAGRPWKCRKDLSDNWKPEIQNIMSVFAKRTPGTFIEEKSYSLVWHYRKAEVGLGVLRAQEMMADIRHFISDRGLQMLQGDKVIEVKSILINKGKTAQRWLDKGEYDFVMAIGDDHPDEDTFKAMPADSITIKVGSHISAAGYFLPNHGAVRKLLQTMIDAKAQISRDKAGMRTAL